MDFSNTPIDDVKNFWDRRPCNIRHSQSEIGSKLYFDQVRGRRYFVEPHISEFADFMRFSASTVLEIGCGIGADTFRFASLGAKVTAVDLSGESIRLAKDHVGWLPTLIRRNVWFVRGNMERLSSFIPIAPYDLIWSFGAIHHTPNPALALTEIRKYMGPNSVFKLMLYHKWSWKALAILFKGWKETLLENGLDIFELGFPSWAEMIAQHSEAQTGCPVTYAYSKSEAKQLLEETGFKVEKMQVRHIFPWKIKDYTQYKYVKAFPFNWMPEWFFKRLERVLGWHLCIEARRG